MTPRETFEIVGVFYEERQRQEKESWKQFRWQTMWFVNMAGKYLKGKSMKETDLFRFPDEISHVDPEERKKQALESAEYHARMAPKKIGRDKDGKPLIYGENN